MGNYVLQERHGATMTIRLNRPERRNAFDLEVRAQLATAIIEARDDETIKAVIIAGSSGIFCAGGDLKSLSESKRPIFKDRARIRNLHQWFKELSNLEKPVIAAVDGPAYGAGFNLALACDFILGTENASFCASFGKIGLVPDLGGFFLLPRIVGLQRAKDIVFTARRIDIDEACEMGMIFKKVKSSELDKTAIDMAEKFHSASTEAIGIAKNVLNRSFNLDQDTLAELEGYAQALALHTEYHEIAVNNFLNKIPPTFNWEQK